MKTNEDLQKDVQDAIKWEPLLNAAEIGVTVKDGIVSLTGIVDSYAKKVEAEEAAKQVAGVQAVVERIEVRLDTARAEEDHEIAREVVNVLKESQQVPTDHVLVKVEKGWVTLEGELSWQFQKEAAKQLVNNLISVEGLTNNIIIKAES